MIALNIPSILRLKLLFKISCRGLTSTDFINMTVWRNFKISNCNGLRLVMTFSYSRYNSQIKLSQEEMLEISQEINREFAPSFSIKEQEPASQQKLSPKELFDISEEISLDFAPKASNNPQEVVILPVDLDHLYVYWNLGDNKLNGTKTIASGARLTLSIYSEPKKIKDITQTKSLLDIDINSTQAQQKFFLPLRSHETAYKATIGKYHQDNSIASFTSSNVTHNPFGKVIPQQGKDTQSMFKTQPQLIAESPEISLYTNHSASGQGKN
jgi:hypothetical protein